MAKIETPTKVFSDIYTNGLWSVNPWNSGAGSDPATEGKEYCFLIPALLKALIVRKVVDFGCGDGRIMAQVAAQCPGMTFTGIDCCPGVLESPRATWPAYHWKEWVDDNYASLPSAHVYLVKDVFHHWPSDRIGNFIYKIQQKCSWLICTQDNKQTIDGADCLLGAYRALDGSMMPLKKYNPLLLTSYLHKSVYLIR